jgi:hypothetical protein
MIALYPRSYGAELYLAYLYDLVLIQRGILLDWELALSSDNVQGELDDL